MLSYEDKILIKNLWQCKGFTARRLMKEFPQQKLEATNTGGLSDELRQRLVAVWNDLEQHVIDIAIDQSVATSAQSVCPCKGWTL